MPTRRPSNPLRWAMSTASHWASAAPAARPTPPRTAAPTRSAVPPVVWTCPTRWRDRSTSRSNSTSPAPNTGSVRPPSVATPTFGGRAAAVNPPDERNIPHEKQQTRAHPGRGDRRALRHHVRDSLCRAERTRPARRLDALLRPAGRRYRPADSAVAARAAQRRPTTERYDAGPSARRCPARPVDARAALRAADRGADDATTAEDREPARQRPNL